MAKTLHTVGRRRRAHGWLGAVTLLLSAIGLPEDASAQTEAELALARGWYEKGVELEKQGDYEAALEEYRRALEVKATPQIHLRVGFCSESAGRWVAALDAYGRSAELAKAEGVSKVQALAEEALDKLEPRVPRLTLELEEQPPDVAVRIDDEPVAAATIGHPLPVDPGTRELLVEAPGYLPVRETVDLSEGQRETLTLVLEPDPEAGAATPPKPPPDVPEEDNGGASPVPGVVVASVGAVGVGVGVALLVSAAGIESDVDDLCGGPDRSLCPEDQRDAIEDDLSSAESLRIGGFVAGGAGVGLLAFGTVWAIVAATSDEEAAVVEIAPFVGRDTRGVVFSGAF